MAQPDGAQSGDGTAQGGGDGSGTGTAGTGAQSGTGTDPTTTTPVTDPAGQSATPMVPATELEQVRARMVAADKRAADTEAQLRQLLDKDLPEMDKLKRDSAELQKQNEALNTALQTARIENAFYSANKRDWHDANTARGLLDMTKITIDSDGKVSGMEQAIEALAKSHPYMLKPEAPAGDGQGTTPPVLGTPPAGGNGKPAGTTGDELKKRFPALRARG